jgi:chromosome segregation protein
LVYIKKLEVYGFKSFGFKNTILNLERGLIVITGPNGSGKSNILDAIMFAIGENSPKILRVDKFQSLFHDSQNSSNRLIRVSLTFDNLDRGIPVDKDSVTLVREIEGQTGESQYYLNGKKVAKNIIIELLEIVLATPNKLNIVQQGMITRISELNSEERRKIIEDIVGLSYFDDKKSEALKQLDASDRRLEVALARIGEIRKRIDELEAERNDQLRYSQLESELKKFNAVRLSDNITKVRNSLQSQQELLNSKTSNSSLLSSQIEEIRSEIEKLQSEKIRFIQEVDTANKAKSQIENRITSIVYEYERKKAMAKESEQRCLQIEKIIPSIDIERQNLSQKQSNLQLQLDKMQSTITKVLEKQSTLKSELDNINSKIDYLSKKSIAISNFRLRQEERYKQLQKIKNNIDIATLRLEEKLKIKSQKISFNKDQVLLLKKEIDNDRNQFVDITKSLQSEKTKLDTIIGIIKKLEAKKDKIETEKDSSRTLLDRAENLTIKYEAQAFVAKNAMSEDFAIAEMTKLGEKFAIKGLVCDLVSWEKDYEKSVLAAGAESMKAFVVDNVKSMISIAEYAKIKRLPRLKIIPLDLINYFPKKRRSGKGPEEDDDTDVNIIGSLANFVYSRYDKLPGFLFGNTYLVKTAASAYILAKQGYRAVSVDGELFEPSGLTLSVDFGSKVSDLSEAILLGDSVNALRNTLSILKAAIERKDPLLKQVISSISHSEAEKNKIEMMISNLDYQKSIIYKAVEEKETRLQNIIAENDLIQLEANDLCEELEKYRRRLSILASTLNRITEKLGNLNYKPSIENELAQTNLTRNHILKSMDDIDFELRELITSSKSLGNEIEICIHRITTFGKEKQDLEVELKQRTEQTEDLRGQLEPMEKELSTLRDQEQQIIDSSGTSYTILQEYEHKIKTLTDNERKTSREYHILEREMALLKKDVLDLSSNETRLVNDLSLIGYNDLVEEIFDVEEIIQELTSESEKIKPRINLRANDSYIQVIEGYRSMSNRKNELEVERNSIILFIEEIVKEKEKVFMEAFKKVDTNLRRTFSEVTGEGQSWLEIENTEDIFSSGIMLMVQFPGKPARESTALSGGEKTMAATIFLLALQSLKPSPFYLLDEVDAHLDSQNTERLSRVLLSRSLDSNQIIMVTLKDSTVSKASLIYGVYSKEGVSQIIRYRHNNNNNNNQLAALAEINNNSSSPSPSDAGAAVENK